MSTETADRILEVAEDLGYKRARPRRPADSAEDTYVIALVISDIGNPFFGRVMIGLQESARTNGYTVLLIDSREDAAEERAAIGKVLHLIDGIVLSASRMSNSAIQQFNRAVPVVSLNPQVPGVTSILPDCVQGMHTVVEYLASHGHVPAEWLARDISFADPTGLLLTPDHYTNRLLHSLAGVELTDLGVPVGSGLNPERSRTAFRLLCEHWHLLAGTPVQTWFTEVFHDVFGVRARPSARTADAIYDQIDAALRTPEFTARALYQRFNIAVLATTDDPCSDLAAHRTLAADPDWNGRVIPTFRPDAYLEPARPDWRALTEALGLAADQDVSTYAGHVEAMRRRRAFFKSCGAVSSDHSHADAGTQRLEEAEAEALYSRALAGKIDATDAARLRRHMVSDQARLRRHMVSDQARLVVEHRLGMDEAAAVARDLVDAVPRRAFKLG